jgi:hypothetical protein
MLGVPRELIEHALNVHPKAVPKKQRLRRFAHDKRDAIKWEIAKLLAAEFIKEVIHPEWVANPVLVKKKNNEWTAAVTIAVAGTAPLAGETPPPATETPRQALRVKRAIKKKSTL